MESHTNAHASEPESDERTRPVARVRATAPPRIHPLAPGGRLGSLYGPLVRARADGLPDLVWELCGDSEMAEGSIWEAFEHAAFNGLDNLTAIIDVNRLGQTGETMHGWDLDAYAQRAEANGWHAIKINGHDVAAIDAAYAEAIGNTGRPTVILAKTEKGHGVAEVANKNGFHGKPLPHPEEAIAELGGIRNIHVDVPKPEGAGEPHRFPTEELQLPAYEPGGKEATR